MKVAIILGNGFDIKIGLNTRYTDFYKAFLRKEGISNTSSITRKILMSEHHVLSTMMNDHHSLYWADLEMQFGNTIKEYTSIDKIMREKSYLEKELNDYLRDEQERVVIDNTKSKILKEELDKTVYRMITGCIPNTIEGEKFIVTFMTFNYTDAIDRLIEAIPSEENGIISYIRPYHLHGTINDEVILGVDNEEQYNYPPHRDKKNELSRIMVKPLLNKLTRPGFVEEIMEEIDNLDIVLIYGSSIGITDTTWWKILQKWALDKPGRKICIYGYIDEITRVSATSQMQLVDYKDRFLGSVPYNQWYRFNNLLYVKKCEEWMFSFTHPLVEMLDEL